MAVSTLTRNIFTAKNFKLRSFMKVPSVYVPNTSTTATISAYPCLMFTYDPPSSMAFDQRPKDAFFKMNPKNQRAVNNFFHTAASWFESDLYQDLFITDEHDGRLIVNMDYRDLKVQIQGGRYDPQSMLAIPAALNNDSVWSEGIALAINRTNYTCALTDVEVQSLVGILDNFSFQSEIQLLIELAARPEFRTDQPPKFGGRTSSYDPSRKVDWT